MRANQQKSVVTPREILRTLLDILVWQRDIKNKEWRKWDKA
jgi:hypothetical protein